ncbi:hypothetical protein [Nocardia sp. NPDC024068]|uniref:hypothetical protein n=1 Tax=Nocardia sp. NPDC024068 TaxID=3157197 RepID=UPI0033BFF7E7
MTDSDGADYNPVTPVNPADPLDPSSPLNPMNPIDADDLVNPEGSVVPVVPVVEENPMRSWLWPTVLIFGLVVGGAIVVMILVSTADFGSEPAPAGTPTPGPCQPFCTNAPAPPAP